MQNARMLRVILCALFVWPAAARSAEAVGTLTLDALSYVSFQDEEVLTFPPGSTIRFHFGEPNPDGSIPFTLTPADVSIAPLALSGGGNLIYSLASPTSGRMETTAEGRKITFTASVNASLDGPNGGTFTYSIPFSTESVSATNAAGTESVAVSGMRLVEGAWHVQIVGATVNRTNAFPKPGTAVYTVLSGQFDQVP